MSYEKVKSISITEDKVFINCASNNVRPLTYSKEEYPSFSKILIEEGKQKVEIALLRNYEEGNLQGGTNKFSKALKVLRYVYGEEYFKFNWRNHNARYGTPERESENKTRDTQEFKDLLLKCLNYKFPKTKWIITQERQGEIIYAKVNKYSIGWRRFKEKATKFNFKEEAELNIYDSLKSYCEVQELK